VDNLNLQETIEQLSSQMIERLDGLQHLSEQEYEEDRQIIIEFNKIAAGMLQQEPGIDMPNSPQPIPMDGKMVLQALSLFSEGIYFALSKCAETGIVGDLKKSLLQNLAMEVYNQSKQVVAATYGQEHTPEFQFTHEQQVEIINKATEGHLVAFITEYEQVNGPIQPELPAPAAPPDAPAQETAAPAMPAQKSPAAQPPATSKAQGPTPHDKYGAVALLLTTLPDKQRARILKSFNPEEIELIKYYSVPQNLEQNLDLASVEMHLKQLRELLKQGGAGPKNPAFKGIAQLAKQHSAEKLLSCVKDERPLVKRYLQSHYKDEPVQPIHRRAITPGHHPEQHGTPALPDRIEEILYRYLSKRLAPA
jgi:hypothetical protein